MSSTLDSSYPLSNDRSAALDPGAAGGPSPTPGVADAAPNGQEMMGRFVQGAHDTIDRLADTAAPHVQRLQETMSTASDVVKTRADELRETGDEWAESLRTTVREHPLAALAAAVAVGVLVSRMTRR